MQKQKKNEKPDRDNPGWTKADLARAKKFDTLPAGLRKKLRGRPKAEVTKERITIRLSRDVVASFRKGGAGWQTRLDAALKDWLTHKAKH
jgi:uncharacterized protein (DUF4415 family)